MTGNQMWRAMNMCLFSIFLDDCVLYLVIQGSVGQVHKIIIGLDWLYHYKSQNTLSERLLKHFKRCSWISFFKKIRKSCRIKHSWLHWSREFTSYCRNKSLPAKPTKTICNKHGACWVKGRTQPSTGPNNS